jgi:hypothetical protein
MPTSRDMGETFHAIPGSNPTASYSGEVKLNANDTVTFVIGYGKNKTNYGDTTGLFAHLVLIPGKTASGH